MQHAPRCALAHAPPHRLAAPPCAASPAPDCSAACQKRDWKASGHKDKCRGLRETSDAEGRRIVQLLGDDSEDLLARLGLLV